MKQLDHPTGFHDEYEQLPREQALKQLYGFLERLGTRGPTQTLEVVGNGQCDDCNHETVLIRLGLFRVCRNCAGHRTQAGQKAAA